MTIFSQSTSKISRIIGTSTFKDSTLVFSGNLVSSVLGAVFFFLLAHRAGPRDFGIFSVTVAAAVTVVDLFDIAINNAMVNFGSRQESRRPVLRDGLIRKLVLSSIFSLLFWLGAPMISRALGQGELVVFFRTVVWLIPARAIYSFVKTALQVSQQFFLDAGVDVLSSLLRLAGMIALPYLDISQLNAAFWSYILALILSVIIALPNIRNLLEEQIDNRREVDAGAFTTYQSWMTLAFIASAVTSRLDVFFLTRLVSLEVVGWYQAAFRLFMPIQQLAGSLSRVFAPRFASFAKSSELRVYMRKSILLSTGLAILIFLPLPVFPSAIKLLYGSDFIPATSMAYGLAVYFAIFLASTPWWSKLLYYHSNARLFAFLSALQLMLIALLSPLGITYAGAIGMIGVLIVSIVAATIVVVARK